MSPYIIVPGNWTEVELNHQAHLLVAAKMTNGGADVSSPQVVIVDEGWPQRKAFLDRVREVFSSSPSIPVYYPGTAERVQKAKETHPLFEEFEKDLPENTSPVFIPNASTDSHLLKEEVFGPVLIEVALDTHGDPKEFLQRVVPFVNENLFGSLSCSLFIDPRTERKEKEELMEAVAKLEYGAIGINELGGTVFFQGPLSWGAFPKHSPKDIQSGKGILGNHRMFRNVQKSVMRGQFMSPSHRKLPTAEHSLLIPRLGWYALRPTLTRVSKVVSGSAFGV